MAKIKGLRIVKKHRASDSILYFGNGFSKEQEERIFNYINDIDLNKNEAKYASKNNQTNMVEIKTSSMGRVMTSFYLSEI